jgi:hypothetical protein
MDEARLNGFFGFANGSENGGEAGANVGAKSLGNTCFKSD